jgi:hypothetical protein
MDSISLEHPQKNEHLSLDMSKEMTTFSLNTFKGMTLFPWACPRNEPSLSWAQKGMDSTFSRLNQKKDPPLLNLA